MPAELKVNIWGFSNPSRCLESMDWLVLAASVRLCRQARANFKCVSAAFEPAVTWTKPRYIILHSSLTPPHRRSCLPSPSPSPLRRSRYVTVWALSRPVAHGASYLCVETWGEMSPERQAKGGLLSTVTPKTIVYWLKGSQSFLRSRGVQGARRWTQRLFFGGL